MTNIGEVEMIARKYFQDLFKSKGVGDLSHVLSGINPCISTKVNQ